MFRFPAQILRRTSLIVALAGLAFTAALASWLPGSAALPPLRDGDLVFQTSGGGQSAAILAATGSPYTHMGIIRMSGGEPVVVEAIGPVRETPLASFVRRGEGSRLAVYRHRTLSAEDAERVLDAARKYYGRGYDIFFSFDNDEIYCSELPYLAFAAVDIPIGAVQPVSSLNISAPAARALIEKRWRQHPVCAADGLRFDQCLAVIMNQALVTPASIAADPQFEQIHSDW